ncbi:hypothetical protein Acor_13860 [Acrocarpospora corrugata]|uniref:histidine kinase n=2 Tax=Acrocarpospora corrugata TaxID=35763 RepID=A0A5M3VW47_9ACTN|nr:hypothetical protein Acor_13860 [Acrocarpospora corrugata]
MPDIRAAVIILFVVVADALLLFPVGFRGWAAAAQVVAVAVLAVLAVRLPVVAFLAALGLALPGGATALLMWASYQAGRQVVSRTGAVAVAGGIVACLGAQVLVLATAPGLVVARYAVFVALPMVLGRYLAQSSGLQSAREAHKRQQSALLATQERLRIARDVHDSLGHRLSLLSIQAAALEVTHLPEPQREAVGQLADTARQALDELHDLVGTLRESRSPEARSLNEIDVLAAEFLATGTPVTVRREGALGLLDTSAAHAVYRVIEEGLTNAAKHAPGHHVTVSLQTENGALLVNIRNPLPGQTGLARLEESARTHPSPESGRAGHGLAGLEERVRLAGGVFQVARSEKEFRLSAMVPLTGSVEVPAVASARSRLWAVALALTPAVLLILAGPANVVAG